MSLTDRVPRADDATEAASSLASLRLLADCYAAFFHDYDAVPVLAVSTENLNPVERAADFTLLLSRIEGRRGRREFFKLAA